MSDQHSPGTDPMVGEVRFKVPLPILIPVAALAVIALVTIGMSKVLLAIPPEAATTVALASAANVLIAAAILAHRKRMGSTSLIEMGVIVVYPIVIGVVIALLGIGSGEGHAGADEPPPAQSGPVTAGGTLSAETLLFTSDAIELVAGEESEITLDNADSAPHNVWIYETAADADASERRCRPSSRARTWDRVNRRPTRSPRSIRASSRSSVGSIPRCAGSSPFSSVYWRFASISANVPMSTSPEMRALTVPSPFRKTK